MKRFAITFILPLIPLFGGNSSGMCGERSNPFTPKYVSPMGTPFFQLYREVVKMVISSQGDAPLVPEAHAL